MTVHPYFAMHGIKPRALSEKQWQQQVLDLARLLGWRTYHPFDSRRSVAGYPDLTMVRGSRLLFVELKTATGRLRPEQREWLDALERVTGGTAPVEVYVWRPADLDVAREVLAR